jgi:hypothetical protein
MAVIFRTPLFTPTPTRRKFQGLVEVGMSFVLSTLVLNSTTLSQRHELPAPPKRPTYTQVDPVPNVIHTQPPPGEPSVLEELTFTPRRPVYNQIDPVPSLLFTTLHPQVGVPFNAVDIPDPPRRPIAQEPWQVQAPVLTTLALTNLQRVPLELGIPKRPVYNQLEPPPNLLNNTLVPTVVNQYLISLQKDRPNPPRRPIAQEPWQVQAPVLTTLALTNLQRIPLELSVPKKPVYVQVDEFGIPIELRISAALTPPIVPPIQENPSPRKLYNVSGTFYPGERIAPPAPVAPPFFQNDQPNPNRRDPDLKALTHTVVAVFGVRPFVQNEQPNPSRRPIYNQQAESGPNNLIIGIPRVPPFRLNDQPNPSKRPVSYQDQNRQMALEQGIPVPVPPGEQSDFPNPSRRPIYYQDFNRGPDLTQPIPVPPAPTYQTDQPNPPRRPIYYQDFNRGPDLTQPIPVPPPPFYQTDYPNPIQGKPRIQYDHVPDPLLYTLVVPPVNLPFSQYDWPNPQRLKSITNNGIFDFGSSVFGSGNNWTIIAGGTGTWQVINDAGTNAWGIIVTGTSSWSPLTPKNPTGNSGGVS